MTVPFVTSFIATTSAVLPPSGCASLVWLPVATTMMRYVGIAGDRAYRNVRRPMVRPSQAVSSTFEYEWCADAPPFAARSHRTQPDPTGPHGQEEGAEPYGPAPCFAGARRRARPRGWWSAGA